MLCEVRPRRPRLSAFLVARRLPDKRCRRLETRQPFEAFRNEQAVPPADRIVVQQQGPCNIFATPAIVQKHQRVRTPGQTMSGRSVPSQLDQVLPRFSVQKPGPYHPFGRIRIAPFGKGVLRILGESGYIIMMCCDFAPVSASTSSQLLSLNRVRAILVSKCTKQCLFNSAPLHFNQLEGNSLPLR